jgi:hypothetical protein
LGEEAGTEGFGAMTVQRKNRQHARQIDLGSGKYAVIDAEDAARVRPHPWYLVRLRSRKLCAQTYLREKGRKKAMFLQCSILGRQNIRFCDNDGLNCTKSNLEIIEPKTYPAE